MLTFLLDYLNFLAILYLLSCYQKAWSKVSSGAFCSLSSSFTLSVYICEVVGELCLNTLCTSVSCPPCFKSATAVVCLREWAVNSFPSKPIALSPLLHIAEMVRVVSRSP